MTSTSEKTVAADVVLECRGLSAGYAGAVVCRDLDITVRSGEVVALIGANGAGKSTTMLTVAGELAPISGEISVLGSSRRSSLSSLARRGLSYVTEERSVIMGLTGAENLRLAGVSADAACAIFPELRALLKRPAGLLSGGEQQMLTLARALAREPRLLLADELSLGLAPQIVQRLLAVVREAADRQGLGVLLVEQHVRQVLAVADRVYVLRRGAVMMEGTAVEIGADLDAVQRAYLAQSPTSTEQ
ncbi:MULTISPECIES: ABC transporter ATP-binding protein [Rhodococcus]|uniref:ABC transporter ATP-binding protein n=1 Tax=Rhodococcus TaxID=1827 RepID=UPI0012096D1D|nr:MULTISPECIES: ATP-binding cassette domain-containing protein [Rhodococcus]MCE4267589.1 ATP-binding cassette domain-containing protein [Rhodococcus globerulus]RZL21654.1 MAG: ATP-binding cassette domain-containing protein [Rhodococcus sp. (in: high G+C Gram-positive bacteria)]